MYCYLASLKIHQRMAEDALLTDGWTRDFCS